MNIIALISAMTGAMILVLTVLIGNRLKNKWLGYGFAIIGMIIGVVTIAYIPSFIGDDRSETSAKSGEYLVYIVLFFTVVKSLFFRKKNKEDSQKVEQAPEQITGLGHGLSTKQENKISTFAKLRKNASIIASIAVLSILAVTIIKIHFSVEKNTQQSKVAISELKDLYFNEQTVSEPITVASSDKPKSSKEIIIDLTKVHVKEKLLLNKGYQTEYDELGIHLLLDIARIEDDKNMKKIMPKFQQGYDVISKYKALNEKLFESYKTELVSLDINPETKKHVIAGFNNSEEDNRKKLAKYWQLQKDSVQELESLATWLASEEDQWGIDNEKFIFQTTEKLEIFNQFLANLNHISDQEDKLIAAQDKKIRNL